MRIEAHSRLRGSVRTPGDKSISHRAVMLAALANGASRITGYSNGDDVRRTIRIVSQLGATIHRDGDALTIVGPPGGLSSSPEPLDCGNSGTSIRLLSGLLGSVPGDHLLVGDDSLQQRPMDRIAAPLREMGLHIDGQGERVLPPLRVRCSESELIAIDYSVPVASAQVKSAILLAALRGDGPTTIHESIRTRANTEEMLVRAGVEVRSVNEGDGRRVTLKPSRPHSFDWSVPGDPSQAAFFVVLALIHRDAVLTLPNLYGGPERTGFLSVLQRMGGDLEIHEDDDHLDVTARSSKLTATEIHSREIPSVDEVPILAVAAAAAKGVSVFRDVGELRIKESDRFTKTLELLADLGVSARGDGDDLIVEGLGSARFFKEFSFRGSLDHRMVMSAAVAAASAMGGTLESIATVSTSYPAFFEDLASLQ